MNVQIEGAPAFAYMHADLDPGETIIAEADAMSSMDTGLTLETKLNGGVGGAIAKGLLGGESLFVNHFTNNTQDTRRVTLVQSTPGDMRQVDLNGGSLCLQPGAYIASTPGIKLGVQFAGVISGIMREGFFKLVVSGHGSVWYGAYGALVEKEVTGSYIVDSSHLVAYEPQMHLNIQMAGSIIDSFTSGEGFVTRVEGNGKIVIQTRSLNGLVGWLNPKLF